MKSVYGFLLCLILGNSFLFAGTPPVTELTTTKSVLRLSVGTPVPEFTVFAKTQNGSAVIPNEFTITPELPEGLVLVQGQSSNKNTLFIQGTPLQKMSLKRFCISAGNNGNKVNNMPLATCVIDIVVEGSFSVTAIEETDSEEKIGNLTLIDTANIDVQYDISDISTVAQPIALGGNVLAIIDSDCQVVFFDITTKTHIKTMDLNFDADAITFSNGVFIVFGALFFDLGQELTALFLAAIDGNSLTLTEESELFGVENYPPSCDSLDIIGDKIMIVLQFENNEKGLMEVDRNNLSDYKLFGETSFTTYNNNAQMLVVANTDTNQIFTKKAGDTDFKQVSFNEMQLTQNTPIVFGNGCFWFVVKHSFLGLTFLMPISGKDELGIHRSMIPIGSDIPTQVVYGNGFLACISKTKLIIFNAQTGEKVLEDSSLDAYTNMTFGNNLFFIQKENQIFSLDTRYLENGLQPVAINSNVILANCFGSNEFAAIQHQGTVSLLRLSDFQMFPTDFSDSKFVAKAQRMILSISEQQADCLDMATGVLKKISLPGIVNSVDASDDFFVISYQNADFISVIDEKTLQRKDLLLDFTPIVVQAYLDKIIILSSQREIKIYDATTQEKIIDYLFLYPHFTPNDFVISSFSNLVTIVLLNSGEDGKTFFNKIITFNLENNEIVSYLNEPNGIRSKAPFFCTYQVDEKTVFIVSQDSTDEFSLERNEIIEGESEEGPLFSSAAFGNRILAHSQKNNKVSLLDVETKELVNIVVTNPKEIFFVDGKFLVNENDQHFVLIDSISKRKLGSIGIFGNKGKIKLLHSK